MIEVLTTIALILAIITLCAMSAILWYTVRKFSGTVKVYLISTDRLPKTDDEMKAAREWAKKEKERVAAAKADLRP
jgi:hypothetical protein